MQKKILKIRSMSSCLSKDRFDSEYKINQANYIIFEILQLILFKHNAIL